MFEDSTGDNARFRVQIMDRVASFTGHAVHDTLASALLESHPEGLGPPTSGRDAHPALEVPGIARGEHTARRAWKLARARARVPTDQVGTEVTIARNEL